MAHPTLPMNITQVNTQQPMVMPPMPSAGPSSPQGMLPSQVAGKVPLGCGACNKAGGVPQFRDIVPNTWPGWAKGLLALGVAGAFVTTVCFASRRYY